MSFGAIGMTLVLFVVLVSAMIQDILTRTVPNRLWIASVLLLSPLLAITWVEQPAWIWGHLGVILLVFVLSFLLSAAGVMGGADWKGLTITAIAIPPQLYYDPLGGFIHPALDAFVPALLIGEAARRWFNMKGWPLFASYTPLAIVSLFGVTLWSSIVRIF